MMHPSFILLLFCLNTACTQHPVERQPAIPAIETADAEPHPIPCRDTFSRDTILARLRHKIKHQQPLLVHVFVPLCDNVHQGIVPVNKQLGDGLNLRTNLYWGAGYGVKSFFKADKSWKLLYEQPDPAADILERVVFEKKYPNGARVLLLADAYRGDRMRTCIRDFLNTLSGHLLDTVRLKEGTPAFHGTPDLAILNGHNGLMDMELENIAPATTHPKDAAVIACASHPYFEERLQCAAAFPLLTTRHLLAPEAYVMAALIEGWAVLENEKQIRVRAAKAYAQYQNCGYKGASRIFHTGW
ncbi:MAG: hypothetical protein L6Q97_05830 [Thermoanaerobaculia bacterium]|nr:hypothetical protein [Thermoanaerobaculia bacterium]